MTETRPPSIDLPELVRTGDNVIDLHREVSIAFLKSTSAFAVRTPRGQKDPGPIHWNPRTNSREKSNETISIVQKTTDNLGVHLFGNVIDVDVDSDNPTLITALDHFLPHTNHIWGRRSRPRTHRLYELSGANAAYDPAEFPFIAKLQALPDLAVEVRGGEAKSGRYSLLPGSLHPSGEAYEWASIKEARSTPVQVDLFRLIDSIRFACVAALIAPYWTEGGRNELCKALSGFMHRAASYTEELDVGLTFDKEKAQKLLEGVLLIADDDEHDRPARLRTFEQTWQKANEGMPVTGATRLKEITGDDQIIGLLYTLLAYTPDLVQLEEMFEKYAVVRNTASIIDLSQGAKGNYIMNKEAFLFTLSGQYISTPKGKVPIATAYINSARRSIVDKAGLDPTQGKIFDEDGAKVANLWSGWGVEPWSETLSERDEGVELFLYYLRSVISRDDPNLFEWILTWIADIFQNPSEKPGTALVLVGQQGAGKSFLFEKVLRPIIGEPHFAKAGTTERLMSKFNMHMSGKLMIQGEEVISSHRRTDAESLKDAITSSKRTIESKGRDSFEMIDYTRYGFTSNHTDNAVNIGIRDRRFTIAHVSDKYAHLIGQRYDSEQTEFWRKMHDWCETRDEHGRRVPHRENLGKLHRYFANLPLKRALINRAYDTKIKQMTQQNSSRGMDAWLLSIIELSNPFDSMREHDRGTGHSFARTKKGTIGATDHWPEFVSYSKLEQSLRQYTSREYGEGRSAQQIAKYFKEQGLVAETEERKVRAAGKMVRARPFPSREGLREHLKELGYDVLDSSEDREHDDQDENF